MKEWLILVGPFFRTSNLHVAHCGEIRKIEANSYSENLKLFYLPRLLMSLALQFISILGQNTFGFCHSKRGFLSQTKNSLQNS